MKASVCTLLVLLIAIQLTSTLPFINTASIKQLSITNESTANESAQYSFQVGVYAVSNSGGYHDEFGTSVTAASVEIRVLDQRLIHPDAELSYWLGIDLLNDAFVQVGYDLTTQNGEPRWFWEYFLPGTAIEGTGPFLGSEGTTSIGQNGTWVTFSLQSTGTTWAAYVAKEKVGSIDLKRSDSGNIGPFASAEVSEVKEADNVLGPVEFRNFTYRDTSGTWHSVDNAVSLCCYSVGSDKYYGDYPYGVAGIPGDNNHWLAGSNLPIRKRGVYVWPWYQVKVSSSNGESSGSGWYVKDATITPNAPQSLPINENERYGLAGWSVNGVETHSLSFTVDQDMDLEAIYAKQYLVSVTSSFGSTSGSGWYDEGSVAAVKVTPTTIPENGWLASLGVKHVFAGWGGTVSEVNGASKVVVNSPMTIDARWGTDFGVLPIIAVIATVAAAVSFKKITSKTKSKKEAIKLTMFCRFCGMEISRASDFCMECGRKLAAD